jgi:hypothetical protein
VPTSNFKSVRIVAAFILFYSTLNLSAQQADSTRFKLFTKKNLVIAGLVAQQASSTLIEYEWWWKDSTNKFHFEHDGFLNNYSFGMDKLGHAYTSYMYFVTVNEVMKWAKFSDKTRLYTSVILPAAWAISIEIGDAMAPYGFSVPDLAANFSGIGYGLLQDRVPFFQNIDFKFSYYPRQGNFNVSSNYDDHIYWLSFNMHNLLPKPIGRKWPELINLAIGYSIKGYNIQPQYQRELMFGIDLNLRALKTKNSTLKTIRNIANLVHLPAPGVKHTLDGKTEFKGLLMY